MGMKKLHCYHFLYCFVAWMFAAIMEIFEIDFATV